MGTIGTSRACPGTTAKSHPLRGNISTIKTPSYAEGATVLPPFEFQCPIESPGKRAKPRKLLVCFMLTEKLLHEGIIWANLVHKASELNKKFCTPTNFLSSHWRTSNMKDRMDQTTAD